MDIDYMLIMLDGNAKTEGYENLQKLEKISEESNILYPYINKFINMVNSDKYVIRVRGFRLACKQAKWDSEDIINDNIDTLLKILQDEKPTAIRMGLKALEDLVIYKKELNPVIQEATNNIDFNGLKDTMAPLIIKDIDNLIYIMNIKKEK